MTRSAAGGSSMLTIVVIAKECVPGRVKTRLTPALSPEQAADVAFASLTDTLETVASLGADHLVLAFDGDPANAPAAADGFEVVQQACGGLDNRLGAIFDTCTGPTLLVGMDTPQLTEADLRSALAGLAGPDSSGDVETHSHAWLGFANDGGFWALGMTDPDGLLIRGVPMSRDDTGSLQLQRLVDAGLGVTLLPELVDVDTFADAVEVAAAAPDSRFAAAFAAAVSTAPASARPTAAPRSTAARA
ncbi:TIGR04282 family arsenosugar biosynthesis glycosyltransferase [Subtercola sp. YIM 133946]|uniref:TIGR04282 family arsenosugar biosynthesis glycosyltransferase n=1 Tax=Subtercola sp. YIM 133946 TaxID=3118909 RepID=UPI002F93CFE3